MDDSTESVALATLDSDLSPEQADHRARGLRICDRIADGKTKVHAACASEGVTWQTFWSWKSADPVLSVAHARAREVHAHVKAEETLDIADGVDDLGLLASDIATKTAESLPPEKRAAFLARFESARVQRDTLRVRARQWSAERGDRRAFGDAVDITSGGEVIKPAVAILPPLDPMPIAPPEGSATFERVREISRVSVPADVLRAALAVKPPPTNGNGNGNGHHNGNGGNGHNGG